MVIRHIQRSFKLLNIPNRFYHLPSSHHLMLTSLFHDAQKALPLTQYERILINNALLEVIDHDLFRAKLLNNGIPSYFVTSFDFRNRFIDYVNKDVDSKLFIRKNIDSLKDTNLLIDSNVSDDLINHLKLFIEINMPQILVACHSLRRLSDLRLFENRDKNLKRKVVAHIGPPNSGKTHDAFIRLSESDSGVYCSPLRILAWEMQAKLINKNVQCDLLTGQERTLTTAKHLSCTIEMTPFNILYDCAIIDEIQMAGDPVRGYAWTNAFLNIKASEVHACGNESCIELVKLLANMCNDKLEIKYHKRLNNMVMMNHPISLQELEPGDCIICFSRHDVFSLRDRIESLDFKWKNTDNIITSIVYGTLPPEIRCSEINKFNNGSTKILIASDAVGMGVNMSIRRIIFYKMYKFDGSTKRLLNSSEVQQISARAGRHNMNCGDGKVSCMDIKDMKHLKKMLGEKQNNLEKATISPSSDIIRAFNSSLREVTRTSTIVDALELLSSSVKLSDTFQLCDFGPIIKVGKALKDISLPDDVLIEYLFAPVTSNSSQTLILRAFAISHSIFNKVKLSNILNQDLFNDDVVSIDKLKYIETLYNILDMYLWLSFKFPKAYPDQDTVYTLKNDLKSMFLSELEKNMYQIHYWMTDSR